MADVAFDSNKHAQTRQDVEHGGAAIASSSEAITRLSNGQYERFWTDEAGPQALRNAFIAFLGAYGKIAATERDTLRSFGLHLTDANFFNEPLRGICRGISIKYRSRNDGGRQRRAHPGSTDGVLVQDAR